MKKIFSAAAAIFFAAIPASAQGKTALERALDVETASALHMKEPGYPSPYYVGITATKYAYREYDCQMGAISTHINQNQSFITDDIRVGNYDLDNYPPSAPGEFLGYPVSLDDDFALRYGLWRALDADYKNAAAGYLSKEALRVVHGKTEYDTDDFSKETPRIYLEKEPPLPWSDAQMAEACRQASAAFRKDPSLLGAQSSMTEANFWSRLQDSQGSKVDFGSRYAELDMNASDIASDGLAIHAQRNLVSVSSSDFPSTAKINAAANELLSDIARLKRANAASPLEAPVLMDPTVASAVILALGARLSGENQRNTYGTQIFRSKIGARVLPKDLSLNDDPTLPSFAGTLLAGHYGYDDQGMPAQKVTLIQDGVLKNFLLSRHPVIGFLHSNGHGRGAPGYWIQGMPGSLILTTAHPLKRNQMLSLLRQECRRRNKPYGILVEKLEDFSQNQTTDDEGSIRIVCEMVYLVSARSGKLTLIRNLDLVGTPLSLMNNILAVGDDTGANNSIQNGVPISVVTPSLLLSDIETQRSNENPEKGPILPPPHAPTDASQQ